MKVDEQAFLEAYDQYAEPIYRFCFFRVFSKPRAEELTQEVFMKVWVYLQEGKQVDNMKAFLYKVANNLVIDESRKKKEESLDARLEVSDAFEPASDGHLSMERAVMQKEVRSVINELPADYREVVLLRYINDLDPKEIATLIGISPNNVSVRLGRAVRMLQERYTNLA